jgi:hypothetical protein
VVASSAGVTEVNKQQEKQPFPNLDYGCSLTSISIVNRNTAMALRGCHQEEEYNGDYEKRWLEAGLCSNGSGQAAGDREQGRQGESRRRPQGECQPLTKARKFCCAGRGFRVALGASYSGTATLR